MISLHFLFPRLRWKIFSLSIHVLFLGHGLNWAQTVFQNSAAISFNPAIETPASFDSVLQYRVGFNLVNLPGGEKLYGGRATYNALWGGAQLAFQRMSTSLEDNFNSQGEPVGRALQIADNLLHTGIWLNLPYFRPSVALGFFQGQLGASTAHSYLVQLEGLVYYKRLSFSLRAANLGTPYTYRKEEEDLPRELTGTLALLGPFQARFEVLGVYTYNQELFWAGRYIQPLGPYFTFHLQGHNQPLFGLPLTGGLSLNWDAFSIDCKFTHNKEFGLTQSYGLRWQGGFQLPSLVQSTGF